MAKLPGFVFYPGDYLRDTQCLSEKSQVAYDRIICEHIREICISKERLNFFAKRLSQDELSELLSVLTKKDKGYCIEWVVVSIEKSKAYSDSRSKNRTSKKDFKPKNISKHIKSYVIHMDNDNDNELDNDNILELEGIKISKNFQKVWMLWIENKPGKFKNKKSETIGILKLHDISQGNPEIAFKIVENSISNGWKGLFPLKPGVNNQRADKGAEAKDRVQNVGDKLFNKFKTDSNGGLLQ